MSSERMTINARDDSHAPAGTSTQSGSPAVLDHVDQNEASHAIATPPETMLPLQSQANTFSNHPLDDPAAARLSQEALEQHYRNVEDELQTLRESESRLKQQHTESQRRERILIRRLALKEQELQDYSNQIMEFKTSQVPGPASLRSALLDPAVNILLQKLKLELQTTRARLEDTQNELSAWKFTPDSNTGKRLMAKCRLLYQENEELGKMTSNGRLAKLEGDLALQKSFSEEVKKSQSELDDFLQELDEDVEGMQSTILFLQQELKTSKETIGILENEITSLKQCATTVEDQLEQKDPHANGYTASMSQDIHVPTLFSTTCNDHPKIMASERLRQTSAANVGKVIPGPRTLRSSSRNIANDDVCSGKVTNRNVRNGNCETIDLHDVENAIPAQIDNAMDQYESGENAEHSNTESADIKNGKITVKRSFDEESDSSEDDQGLDRAPQSDDTNMGKHKNLMKKIRRSSLFKSDNNEENLKGVTHEFNGSSDA